MPRTTARWGKPKCKQEYDESGENILLYRDEHSEPWEELFLELILVALLINLSHLIYYCDDGQEALARSAKIFFLYYNTKMFLEDYSTRFFCVDFVSRSLFFTTALGSFLMAANAHMVESTHGGYRRLAAEGTEGTISCVPNEGLYFGFTAGFVICRASIIIIYGIAMYFYKNARVQFTFTVAIQSLSLVIVFIAFVANWSHDYDSQDKIAPGYDNVFWATTCIEFVTRIFHRQLNSFLYPSGTTLSFYPANLYEVQEKLGQFVLVVLGESFIALITTNPRNGDEKRIFSFMSCSFILLFCFAMVFYDSVHRMPHHGEEVDHAMKRSLAAGIFWQASHAVVGFVLFLVGAALKGCYSNIINDEAVSLFNSRLLGCACAFTVLTCAFLRGLHKGIMGGTISTPLDDSGKYRRHALYSLYLLIALSHLIIMGVADHDHLSRDSDQNLDSIFVLHMILAIFLNFAEIVLSSFYNIHLEENEERHPTLIPVKQLMQLSGEIVSASSSMQQSSGDRNRSNRSSLSRHTKGRDMGNELEADLEFMLAKEDYRKVRIGLTLSSKAASLKNPIQGSSYRPSLPESQQQQSPPPKQNRQFKL